jgi:hypothetical protein
MRYEYCILPKFIFTYRKPENPFSNAIKPPILTKVLLY